MDVAGENETNPPARRPGKILHTLLDKRRRKLCPYGEPAGPGGGGDATYGFREWVDGLGPTVAAKLLGVSRQSIYRWLAGERRPTSRMRYRIKRVSKGKVTLRRPKEEPKNPPPKLRPYHVIRIPVGEPRGCRESTLVRACNAIDRGRWPVEMCPEVKT
jgi:hypothetical protein